MKKHIIALLLFLTTFPALATDFVFSVPVKLDRLPKGIPQAKVVCDVFTYRDTENPIASGYTIRPVDSRQGFLIEDVQVNANYHPMQRQQVPHQYHCRLMLLVPWTQPTWQLPGEHAAISALRPRKNSQLVTEVSGLINN